MMSVVDSMFKLPQISIALRSTVSIATGSLRVTSTSVQESSMRRSLLPVVPLRLVKEETQTLDQPLVRALVFSRYSLQVLPC